MEHLKAPSLQSLLESDRGSTDSLLAESLQLDIEDLDDTEYAIPTLDSLPTLESVLSELEGDSDVASEAPFTVPTPTPSVDDIARGGSILRHIILQGISSQISSAADRINAGTATAISVSQMIAVGTSHGHVLNFDNAQTLRWAHQDQTSQGAVSDLAYNEDTTRLLVGFARGLIIMIDTRSGDLLRSLNDAITPNTGVLCVKWTGRPALALCLDSGGSVWSLSFTRKLGIRGCASRCLFSGARGEVCCVEPLVLDDDANHELKNNCIVALATLSKYFIVSIRPRLKVIKYHILNGPAECLPLLAWQMVLIQAADTSRTIDPVLAVARGNQLYFHQIFVTNNRVNLLFLRHVQLTCNLLAVHWMGPKSLACMDTTEMLHLIDVRSSKEMECVDMANAGLVYGSAQFKGLATGGNVSPALALAGTYACYSSIDSKGTQIYVLGARSLHMVSIRSWKERISYLVNNQRWIEACELAIDGYRSAGDRCRRKQQAKDRIIELFNEYISKNRTPEFGLGPIIKCLIEINELDLLWQELWDRLNSPDQFLLLVTEHIENENVKRVSPSIAQALVDFWIDSSPKKLEEIILKLDWSCLDLHQVLTAAKKKKLFKAQIYINTHAFGDYIMSLIELIPLVETENPDLGNCLLVYISSCLAGRGYPTGEIPQELIPNVKHEVLRFLTSIHSSRGDENEQLYPYLRTLLKFDTRETLNVISLAFQEKEFSGELGSSHRQRIINILLEIMTPESATWSQIGCLLNFISQQISSKCLPEDPSLLEKILSYLKMEKIDGETPRQHSEREYAWLELITANCLQHIPDSELLQIAEKAKCYTVVEYLLKKLGKYNEILNCYLNNPLRQYEMFTYIEIHSKNPVRKIYQQIYNNFISLLNMNIDHTTKIIIDNFSDNIDELIILIENEPKLLYSFLNNLIKYGFNLNPIHCETYLELLCKENPENVKDFLANNDNYRLENALEIVTKYQLTTSTIFLYEKQGDYQLAFNLSLDILRDAPESLAETSALQVSSLCSRASQVLSEEQREEFWFPLLKLILSRPDLKSITKNMLHLASQHVDLSKLVQLVLNSGTQTGSFGDIKHLLVGMLSNSRYETLLLQTTARILGEDLHNKFAQKRKTANRGLWITFIKCIICRQRLYNQTDVVVLGICGHSMHQTCKQSIQQIENGYNCPRCGNHIDNNESISLAKPNLKIVENDTNSSNSDNLNLKAPPRKF